MMKSKSLFEQHTTTKQDNFGRWAVKCNRGMWEVSSPNKNQATAEAIRYFMQYWKDGEYENKASKEV